MDKGKKLFENNPIHEKPQKEEALFSSQTLKEMEMANLIGGNAPPRGIIDLLCGLNIYCPNVNVVCSACIDVGCSKPPPEPPAPEPLPPPGTGPSYAGSNCQCY